MRRKGSAALKKDTKGASEMNKLLTTTFLVAILVAPQVYASFVDNFETDPFTADGWSKKGDVVWTGGRKANDFVILGLPIRNKSNWIAKSFTVETTGEYSLFFDYRFVGYDLSSRKDDVIFANLDVADTKERLFSFEQSSEDGLTKETGPLNYLLGMYNPGAWTTVQTPPPTLLLEAGKEYWIGFGLLEAKSWLVGTSLHIDNVGLELLAGTPIVPAPGAVFLGGIGVVLVGMVRSRKTVAA